MKQTHEGCEGERQRGDEVEKSERRSGGRQRPHRNESKGGNRISREPQGKINKKRPRIGKYYNQLQGGRKWEREKHRQAEGQRDGKEKERVTVVDSPTGSGPG